MNRRKDELLTAFVAGCCFGILIGFLAFALMRSFW